MPTLKFPKLGAQPLGIEGMTDFVSRVAFADGTLWIPTRADLSAPRLGNQQAIQVPHQQFRLTRPHYRADLQVALAGGIVLRELDMVHSFGCHGISSINCAESTVGGVTGWFRSATDLSTSARRSCPGSTHTGLRRWQLFQPGSSARQ
jgi:hypothetical protein